MSALSRFPLRVCAAGVFVLAMGCSMPAAAPPSTPTAATATVARGPTGTPVMLAAADTPPTEAAAPPIVASQLGTTLHVDTTTEIESPHPFFASQLVGISVRLNIFDSLVERDWDGKIVPGLATSWNIVDDTTIDFKLRDGVTFHNGQEMTANDVKASFDHVLDNSIKAPSTSMFANVLEAVVLDPHSIRLVLSKADARIFDVLANNLAVLPAQYIKDVGADGIARKPIGTGPYTFAEWVKDDHLTLEANPNYWDGSYKGKPQIKTVVLRPVPDATTRLADLRSGTADMSMDVPPDQVAALRSEGFNIIEKDTSQHDYVYFDTTRNTPLKSKEVRQALNYAIDKDSIVQNLLGGFGQPLAGPISQLVLGYNPNVKPYPHDSARARSLLAAAGFPDGFSIDMDVGSSGPSALSEAVVAQLAEVGVKVKLNVLETAVYNDRWVKKQLDPMYFNRWSTFSDPALLDLLAGCTGFLSAYCNAAAQQYLDVGGATLDQAKRDAAYQQAVQILYDDPFAIYLYQLKSLTGLSSTVHGWKAHGTAYLLFTNAMMS